MRTIAANSNNSSRNHVQHFHRYLVVLILFIALNTWASSTLALWQWYEWQLYESSINATRATAPELFFPHENDSQLDSKGGESNVDEMIRTDHAIVVPYRNREKHLQVFKEYMVSFLNSNTENDTTFSLWIIEQDDYAPFNRAWVTNVGISEATKALINTTTKNCIILHDVDLLPLSPTTPYTQCDFPMQLSSEMETWNWGIPYSTFFGGVVSLSAAHWKLVNGMSNGYLAWGVEDDDLSHRILSMGLWDGNQDKLPYRPPTGRGRFGIIDQSAEHHVSDHSMHQKNYARYEAMLSGQIDWKKDGLNSLQYTVTSHETTSTFAQGHDNDYKNNHAGLIVIHHAKVQQPLAPENKLEFVHIAKTGGKAIESAAAKQAGIAWGACHYANGDFAAMGCPFKPPDLEGKITMKPNSHPYQLGMSLWHVPLQFLKPHPFPDIKTFTVVLHPYERAVNLFYCPWEGYKGSSDEDKNNSVNKVLHFNKWIQEMAKHLAPQSTYVYHVDDIGTRHKMVDHILHFEQLPETFNALMVEYQLNVSLPTNKFQEGSESKKMTRLDFTPDTIELLNDIFKDDFDNFGYER